MKSPPFPDPAPVLPITHSLLLPGTVVLLDAVEPTEQRLVEQVVAADGFVGLLQPREERGEAAGGSLYGVGCLGRIEQCQERSDGGYSLLVQGVLRFRRRGELSFERGYPTTAAEYGEFLGDLERPPGEADFDRVREELRSRIATQNPGFDLSLLDRVGGADIVNGLAQVFPFSRAERQALLEAPSLTDRQALLLDLMRMGLARFDPYSQQEPS
jgi:Lon protease-like protein